MQELLLKCKHLFFLHIFRNYSESLRTHMVIFAGPKHKFRQKKRDSLRKFHRTYGLPLENYLSDRVNHYRKCPTVRRPLGNTVVWEYAWNSFDLLLKIKFRLYCILVKIQTGYRRNMLQKYVPFPPGNQAGIFIRAGFWVIFESFFCHLLIFLKIFFFEKLFQEYHQSIKRFDS